MLIETSSVELVLVCLYAVIVVRESYTLNMIMHTSATFRQVTHFSCRLLWLGTSEF